MILSAFTAAHRTESLECPTEIAPTVRLECRDKLANFRRRLKRKSNGRHRADGNRHDDPNRNSLGSAWYDHMKFPTYGFVCVRAATTRHRGVGVSRPPTLILADSARRVQQMRYRHT